MATGRVFAARYKTPGRQHWKRRIVRVAAEDEKEPSGDRSSVESWIEVLVVDVSELIQARGSKQKEAGLIQSNLIRFQLSQRGRKYLEQKRFWMIAADFTIFKHWFLLITVIIKTMVKIEIDIDAVG